MSPPHYRLPLLLDYGAIVIDQYAVADIDSLFVQEFDTEVEAGGFVAKARVRDIETARRKTGEPARMPAGYRENLIRHSRERPKP